MDIEIFNHIRIHAEFPFDSLKLQNVRTFQAYRLYIIIIGIIVPRKGNMLHQKKVNTILTQIWLKPIIKLIFSKVIFVYKISIMKCLLAQMKIFKRKIILPQEYFFFYVGTT